MKYTAYLWDFDGTLFDSYPHIAQAFYEVITAEGIPCDMDTLLTHLWVNFGEAKRAYNLSDALYRRCVERAHSHSLRPAFTLFPGTAALLRAICENGGRNFLYTHRNAGAWTYLRLFGLDKYFTGGVDASMHFPSKPAPDAVEHICRVYGLEKAQTLMIGDREIDVLAGVNAGTDGCLFMSHPVQEQSTCANFTVRSMRELADACSIPMDESDLLGSAQAAQIRAQVAAAAEELCAAAHLEAGNLVVVGCSSSEITGERIGSASSPESANAVFAGLCDVFTARGIHFAAQCCEHLNRSLIVERKVAVERGWEIVNVVPMPKAGGAFAVAAYAGFDDPVAVSAIQADAGLDIGGTLIGMHLKRVAVPLRLSVRTIGQAPLSAARVRRPFAGGERAVYDELLY